MSHTPILDPVASRAPVSTSMGSPRKKRLQNTYNSSITNKGSTITNKGSTITAMPIISDTDSKPNEDAIYKWTLTKDAVASCFIKDVLEMKANENKVRDFYWLGRTPCRVVKLVGMVVGVEVYEKKTMYTLDDGTGIMECLFQHPSLARVPAAPKSLPQSSTRSDPLSKYRATSTAHSAVPVSRPAVSDPAPPPKPIAQVSQLVLIEGRVTSHRDYRRLYVNNIERCRSSNAEVTHWSSVIQLHQTHYFPKTPKPFMIPKPTLAPIVTLAPSPADAPISIPRTPTSRSRVIQVDPTYTSSTLYSSAPSSPTLLAHSGKPEISPIKITHPSRIRPDNLTDLTFRIHLKHYMEHSPDFMSDERNSQYPSDLHHSRSTTPTRPQANGHRILPPDLDRTPRPARSQAANNPRIEHRVDHKPFGFTLSHLRRVPELAILAKRVVKAETSRRAAPSSTSLSSRISREHRSQKMKRLFSSTLIKLHQEGLIVLWDGPAWPLTVDAARWARVSNSLWKDPSSKSSQSHVDKSTASNASIGLHSLDASSVSTRTEDGGELSDPGLDETSYIPVSTALLCDDVESIIKMLVENERRQARTVQSGSVVAKGATKTTITARLRHSDERWMHMGEWIVEDTLLSLKDQGRIWEVGGGRWEVCL